MPSDEAGLHPLPLAVEAADLIDNERETTWRRTQGLEFKLS